jgi:hypothetical protein
MDHSKDDTIFIYQLGANSVLPGLVLWYEPLAFYYAAKREDLYFNKEPITVQQETGCILWGWNTKFLLYKSRLLQNIREKKMDIFILISATYSYRLVSALLLQYRFV